MKYIIEDSSYLISLFAEEENFYPQAVSISRLISNTSEDVRVIIPSTVYYETMFVLLKKGIDYTKIKKSLNYLMLDDKIINLPVTETSILKLAKHSQNLMSEKENKTKIRSNDLLITSIACDYQNSCLITSDAGIKEYKPVYKNIFLFNTVQGAQEIKDFLVSSNIF